MAIYRIGAGLIGNSRHDFRDAASLIKHRILRLDNMAQVARGMGCYVLELPAGFFCVNSRSEAVQLAHEVAAKMARSELLIAFGIDVEDHGAKLASKTELSNSGAPLPYFGFIIENGRLLINCAQQTGIRVNEVPTDRVAAEAAHRTVSSGLLRGRSVSMLLCGEILSEAWRIHLHQEKPTLILHPAHASVVLGGDSKESWKPKVDDLLRGLPSSSAWVFTDHIKACAHSAGGNFVDLVRQGSNRNASLVGDVAVEGGWLYVYDVDLN